MRRFFTIFATVLFGLGCFTACNFLKHEHITGEWEYDEIYHWRIPTCTWHKCDFDPYIGEHIDEDLDTKCDICGYTLSEGSHTEHTGEWHSSEYAHWYQYTCGCPSPEIAEEHHNYDGDSLCDVCGYVMVGHEHIIEYHQDKNGHSWGYICGCLTPPNFAQHWDGNGDGECDDCAYPMGEIEYIQLSEYEEWLLELTAEKVAEIKTTFEYVGVAPGSLKEVKRLKFKTPIAEVISLYRSAKMYPISREDAQVDGGSAFTIEFILTDGTVKELFFNNRNYAYGLGESKCYFKMTTIPKIDEYFPITTAYAFVVHQPTFEMFTMEGERVGSYSLLDELEFVEWEEVPVPDGEEVYIIGEPTHYIVGDAGTLYICSNEIFYRIEDGEKVYYELCGALKFYQLDGYKNA